MPNPQNILIRHKLPWLLQQYLQELLGINDPYMRKVRSIYKATVPPSGLSRDILPDTGAAWRWGSIEAEIYFSYDNIPDKAPCYYKSELPTRDQLIQSCKSSQSINQSSRNANLETYLSNYIATTYQSYLSAYASCNPTQQEHLAKAASLAEAAITYIHQYEVNTKKFNFFTQLSQFIAANGIKYFPEEERSIKRKLEPLFDNTISPERAQSVSDGHRPSLQNAHNTSPVRAQSIIDIIKLPRSGNSNAKGDFNDTEIRAWVLQLRAQGTNYTNAFIIRKIQYVCELTTKPVPSERWIGQIMEEHNTDFLTSSLRFGAKSRYGTMHRGYQPFQNALFAGDCWQIDGTRFNLVENKREIKFTNAQGKEETKTVTPFLYIVAVRDVHSGLIVGYNFTIAEDHKSNYLALENAVRNTGYLPYELVHDRFPGHNYKPMEDFLGTLEQWGTKLTVSTDPNSKGKLERWFGTLQTVFMQESPFYYGQGVKSNRPYAHRSDEYMKKLRAEARKEGWDWDAAVREAEQIIDNYNTTQYSKWSKKHAKVQQSPQSLHEISEKPNVTLIAEHEYAFLFGIRETLPHKAGLIKKTINHADYYYRIPEVHYELISKHSHFLCCFDYNDLSNVQLYTLATGAISQYIATIPEETAAQIHGPNAEWDKVAKRKAVIKNIESFAQQELEYLKEGSGDSIVDVIYYSGNKAIQEAAETQYLLRNTGPDTSRIGLEAPFRAGGDPAGAQQQFGVVSDYGGLGAGFRPATDDDPDELTFNPRHNY